LRALIGIGMDASAATTTSSSSACGGR
jgi:hypothetical protein